MLDVVYPYRASPEDHELRYSLRSLANIQHRKVVISGDRPGFAGAHLTCIETPRHEDRYRDSTTNILAAIEQGDLTDEFVVMHDDIFVLEAWTFRHEHRCTIREYLASGAAAGDYRDRIRSTLNVLLDCGVTEPLWFGLHTPTIYNRDRLHALILEYGAEPVLLRTLYHNLHPQISERAHDAKLRHWPSDVPTGLLSISDEVAQDPSFRAWLNSSFRERSRYEHKASGWCLILGYGQNLWAEARAAAGEFEALVASPEAAQHQNATGWAWGRVDAIGRTDNHCLHLAWQMGFDADQIVFCGRKTADA